MVARERDVAWHGAKSGGHVVLHLHDLGGHGGIAGQIEGFVATNKGFVAEGVFRSEFFRDDHGHVPAIVHRLSLDQSRRDAAIHRVSRGHKCEHRGDVVQDREGLHGVGDIPVHVGHFEPSNHLIHPDIRVGHRGVTGSVEHRRTRVGGFRKRRRNGVLTDEGEVLGHEGELRGFAVHVVHQELFCRRIPALVRGGGRDQQGKHAAFCGRRHLGLHVPIHVGTEVLGQPSTVEHPVRVAGDLNVVFGEGELWRGGVAVGNRVGRFGHVSAGIGGHEGSDDVHVLGTVQPCGVRHDLHFPGGTIVLDRGPWEERLAVAVQGHVVWHLHKRGGCAVRDGDQVKPFTQVAAGVGGLRLTLQQPRSFALGVHQEIGDVQGQTGGWGAIVLHGDFGVILGFPTVEEHVIRQDEGGGLEVAHLDRLHHRGVVSASVR